MHDVACEFACAVGCAETISTNVLKIFLSLFKLFLQPYIIKMPNSEYPALFTFEELG